MKIDLETDIDVIKGALAKWGYNTQVDIAIEEMSELIKALLKLRRSPSGSRVSDVEEEIADVQIMIWQLCEIHDKSAVQDHIEYKLQRLKERVENGNE